MAAPNIPTAPVAGWDIHTIEAIPGFMVRLRYLDEPRQSVDQPHHSPNFLLTAVQARELITTLERGLAKMGNAG